MTLSDQPLRPEGWIPDATLGVRRQPPAFVRMPWTEHHAQPFGPWRLDPQPDLWAHVQTKPVDDLLLPASEPTAVDTDEAAEATAPPWTEPPAGSRLFTDDAWQAELAAAEDRGRRSGLDEAQRRWASEQDEQRTLLKAALAGLHGLAQDPQRWQLPLQRLALHLAMQLVRGELHASGHVVQRLVSQCLAQLDAEAEQVVVHLHPDDCLRLQQLDAEEPLNWRLEPDPGLSVGSVQVRVSNTVVEDLIEHRIETLAQQLFGQPAEPPLSFEDACLAEPDDHEPDTP